MIPLGRVWDPEVALFEGWNPQAMALRVGAANSSRGFCVWQDAGAAVSGVGVGVGEKHRRLASVVMGKKRERTLQAREEGGEARAERALLPPQPSRQAALLRHL